MMWIILPIECGVWRVVRDDCTDVDAVNIVDVIITQEAADQEETDPDIHDQELTRTAEGIIADAGPFSFLCVWECLRNNWASFSRLGSDPIWRQKNLMSGYHQHPHTRIPEHKL